MSGAEKLNNFGNENSRVNFIETIIVAEGVECDVYSFEGDKSRDLAIVYVEPGAKTPLQRVLSGVTTTEGFLSGKGVLTVRSPDGEESKHDFDGQNQGAILVEIGHTMQWAADPKRGLVFYEICVPPYEDGRYENIPE